MQEGEGEGKVKGEGDPHRRDAADPAEVGGGVCGGAREESREGAEESRGEASRVGSITQGEEVYRFSTGGYTSEPDKKQR